MRPIIAISAFALAFFTATLAFGQEPTGSSADVVSQLGGVVDAVRSGSAVAIAAGIIMLLVNLFKAPWLGGLVKKIPKRWRVAIPVLLGGIAGILSSVVGGIPWTEALMVGLFSGPTAVFAHEAVVEAILGKSKSRSAEPAS